MPFSSCHRWSRSVISDLITYRRFLPPRGGDLRTALAKSWSLTTPQMLPEWACCSSVASTEARSGLALLGMCAMVLTGTVIASSRIVLTTESSKFRYFASRSSVAAAHKPILLSSALSISPSGGMGDGGGVCSRVARAGGEGGSCMSVAPGKWVFPSTWGQQVFLHIAHSFC